MSKELPYFKFYTSEWINGDITLESFELQGLFVNICAYYWSKDGNVTMTVLLKKFRGYDIQIQQLQDSNIIKVNNGRLDISFLNEQLDSKQLQKYINQKNGSKGGRPKKDVTENKPNGFFRITEHITESEANTNPNKTNIDYRKEKEIKEEEIRLNNGDENQNSEYINELVSDFGFNEMKFAQQQKKIFEFVKVLSFNRRLDHFKSQHKDYTEFKKLSGQTSHNFQSYIGSIQEKFEDGAWNAENWSKKLETEKIKQNGKSNPKAGINRSSNTSDGRNKFGKL